MYSMFLDFLHNRHNILLVQSYIQSFITVDFFLYASDFPYLGFAF